MAYARIVSDLAAAVRVVRRWKRQRQRIVLANGCFDLIHGGHIRYLTAARRMGDRLVVAVNSDASVRMLKGTGRPIFSVQVRMAMVAALDGVDLVFPFPDPDLTQVLRVLRPHVHCKGGDYTRPEDIPEYPVSRALGIHSAIVGGPKIHSSRRLVPFMHAWPTSSDVRMAWKCSIPYTQTL